MAESGPDSFLQKTKESLFGLTIVSADAFAFVVANAAKKQRFAALDAHHAHTTRAHDFLAMCASERGVIFVVARAKKRPIRQHYGRWGRHLAFYFGNGYIGFRGFHQKHHFSQSNLVADFQPAFIDGLAIDE